MENTAHRQLAAPPLSDHGQMGTTVSIPIRVADNEPPEMDDDRARPVPFTIQFESKCPGSLVFSRTVRGGFGRVADEDVASYSALMGLRPPNDCRLVPVSSPSDPTELGCLSEDGGNWTLNMHRLTRHSFYIAWFSSPYVYRYSIAIAPGDYPGPPSCLSDLSTDSGYSKEEFNVFAPYLSSLFVRVSRFDGILSYSVLSAQQHHIRIANVAFFGSSDTDRDKSLGGTTYQHGTLQAVLYDRICSTLSCQAGDVVPPSAVELPAMPLCDSGAFRNAFELRRDWVNTITSFVKAVDNMKISADRGSDYDMKSAEAMSARVVRSLAVGAKRGEGMRLYGRTQQSLFMASLALHALFVAGDENDGGSGDSAKVDQAKDDLFEMLGHVSNNEVNPVLRTLSNKIDFLRALYVAVSVSPISLLRCSVSGKGGRASSSLSLKDAMSAVLCPAPYIAGRREVEIDLFGLIRDLAVYGSDIYVSSIRRLCSKWKQQPWYPSGVPVSYPLELPVDARIDCPIVERDDQTLTHFYTRRYHAELHVVERVLRQSMGRGSSRGYTQLHLWNDIACVYMHNLVLPPDEDAPQWTSGYPRSVQEGVSDVKIPPSERLVDARQTADVTRPRPFACPDRAGDPVGRGLFESSAPMEWLNERGSNDQSVSASTMDSGMHLSVTDSRSAGLENADVHALGKRGPDDNSSDDSVGNDAVHQPVKKPRLDSDSDMSLDSDNDREIGRSNDTDNVYERKNSDAGVDDTGKLPSVEEDDDVDECVDREQLDEDGDAGVGGVSGDNIDRDVRSDVNGDVEKRDAGGDDGEDEKSVDEGGKGDATDSDMESNVDRHEETGDSEEQRNADEEVRRQEAEADEKRRQAEADKKRRKAEAEKKRRKAEAEKKQQEAEEEAAREKIAGDIWGRSIGVLNMSMTEIDDDRRNVYETAPYKRRTHMTTGSERVRFFRPVLGGDTVSSTPEEVDVKTWPSMDGDWLSFRKILRGQLRPEQFKTVELISASEWDTWSVDRQRECYSSGKVLHIVSDESRGRSSYFGITSWDCVELDILVELEEQRQLHDMTQVVGSGFALNSRMRRAPLQVFVDEAARLATCSAGPLDASRCMAVNYLDLPIVSAYASLHTQSVDNVSRYLKSTSKRRLWRTTLEMNSLAAKWAIVANASVFSAEHIDAGALDTYLEIVLGAKLWAIPVTGDDQDAVQTDDEDDHVLKEREVNLEKAFQFDQTDGIVDVKSDEESDLTDSNDVERGDTMSIDVDSKYGVSGGRGLGQGRGRGQGKGRGKGLGGGRVDDQPDLVPKAQRPAPSIFPGVLNAWNTKSKCEWQICYLKAKDRFFMPAGTPHVVLTLEDCLAVGGHFYSTLTFWNALRALTLEHFFGTYITNTDHVKAPFAFFVYVDVLITKLKLYRKKVKELGRSGCPVDGPIKLPDSFPTWENVACLIHIVVHMDELDPDVAGGGLEMWHGTPEFASDFKLAIELVLVFHRKVRKNGFEKELKDGLERVGECYERLLNECNRIAPPRADGECPPTVVYRDSSEDGVRALNAYLGARFATCK